MNLGLCIEMAMTDLPFEERFKAAADMGLRNVEMWFVRDFSYGGTPDQLAKLARDAGVSITNTVIGSPDGSIGGGLTDPAMRHQWLDRAELTLEFNRAAGIPATIVCTGNTPVNSGSQQVMESVIAGLRLTVDMAERYGVTLLMEPLNDRYDHPGYWLTSSRLGAQICRKLNSPRMKLLFDCYHMQIMEGDLVNNITGSMDVIGHFHSAGVPGRHELFLGEVNYPYVVSEIERLGYRGVFGLEFSPTLEVGQSLRRTIEHFTR